MSLKQALVSQVMEAFGMTEAEALTHVTIAIETILAQIWMSK